jgi:hypothetical protein
MNCAFGALSAASPRYLRYRALSAARPRGQFCSIIEMK